MTNTEPMTIREFADWSWGLYALDDATVLDWEVYRRVPMHLRKVTPVRAATREYRGLLKRYYFYSVGVGLRILAELKFQDLLERLHVDGYNSTYRDYVQAVLEYDEQTRLAIYYAR